MDEFLPPADASPSLFPDLADVAVADAAAASGEQAAKTSASSRPPRAPRLRRPERFQGQMFCESLDERIEADHQVRIVWSFVEELDFAPLLERIKAVEGHQGRNANDPRLLLALWLYANVEGVGSARELERLCVDHRAYQWLCGGVTVNYHTLADFRVQNVEWLDQLLAQSLATLAKEGLVDINATAQDGMRIRASAGSDSFRRQSTIERLLADAEQHLKNLKAELELNPQQLGARRKAAQERAGREKIERLRLALDNVREIAAHREARKKGDGETARASCTDPEARRMKMPDDGVRPAFNAQFATAVGTGIIVGVNTSDAGNDSNEMEPMLDLIENTFGKTPDQHLVDGGYSTRDNAAVAKDKGIELFTPLREEGKQLSAGKDPYAPKKGDNEAMIELRARMQKPESKAIYKLRGQTAEWVNAQARNCGYYQVRVRGKQKVQAALILFALAHNLLRAHKLRAERETGRLPEATAN
jgi:transposase